MLTGLRYLHSQVGANGSCRSWSLAKLRRRCQGTRRHQAPHPCVIRERWSVLRVKRAWQDERQQLRSSVCLRHPKDSPKGAAGGMLQEPLHGMGCLGPEWTPLPAASWGTRCLPITVVDTGLGAAQCTPRCGEFGSCLPVLLLLWFINIELCSSPSKPLDTTVSSPARFCSCIFNQVRR